LDITFLKQDAPYKYSPFPLVSTYIRSSSNTTGGTTNSGATNRTTASATTQLQQQQQQLIEQLKTIQDRERIRRQKFCAGMKKLLEELLEEYERDEVFI
jgi:hypothetical protein